MRATFIETEHEILFMNATPPDDLRSTLPEIPSPPHDPELHEQQLHDQPLPSEGRKFTPPPKKSLTPWVAVFPLILLGGALWQSDAPDASRNAASMTGNAVQTPRATPTPAPKTDPTPSDSELFPKNNPYTLFVPNGDGALRKTIVKTDYPGPTTNWSHFYGTMASYLVDLLLQKSPRSFPKGTELLEERAKVEGDVVTLNFNKAFVNPDFWRGESRTTEAIYSIVNTVSNYGEKDKPNKVRFLVEGKPIPTLGEFDTSDAILPDMSLVAKS